MELEVGNVQNKEGILLMFSGGRDSFLSACRLIEDGYKVHLITYHNGRMSGVECVKETANRIIGKYGQERVQFAGIYSIATDLYRLQEDYQYKSLAESSKEYPDLLPYQMSCLACHTAMYVASIAYCKVHGINAMAEGARESQGFFVELQEMSKRYKELAEQNGIKLILPVYDMQDDWLRKLELGDRGFIPKVLELQCWLGCPMRGDLKQEQIDSLARYYDRAMKPRIQEYIKNKTKVQDFADKTTRYDNYEI